MENWANERNTIRSKRDSVTFMAQHNAHNIGASAHAPGNINVHGQIVTAGTSSIKQCYKRHAQRRIIIQQMKPRPLQHEITNDQVHEPRQNVASVSDKYRPKVACHNQKAEKLQRRRV
jgi:hypothetical protein